MFQRAGLQEEILSEGSMKAKIYFCLPAVTGFDRYWSIITIGVVCTIYTAAVSTHSLKGSKHNELAPILHSSFYLVRINKLN